MKSIRLKLILSYLVLTLLVIFVIGTLSFSLLVKTAQRQEQSFLTSTAAGIARQVGEGQFHDIGRLKEIAETAGFFNNVSVQILDPRKKILTGTESGASAGFRVSMQGGRESSQSVKLHSEELAEMLEESRQLKERLQAQTDMDLDGYVILRKDARIPIVSLSFQMPDGPASLPPSEYISGPAPQAGPSDPAAPEQGGRETVTVPVGDPENPSGFIRVGGGPDLAGQVRATALNAFIFAAFGALAAAVFFGIIIGNRMTKPILQLSRAVQALEFTGPDRSEAPSHVEVPGKDEIGELAKQFNTMADRLFGSYTDLAKERDVLKSFMQDASHHLRTPVTALMTFSEILRSEKGSDEKTRKEFLTESSRQLEKISWLIDKLLKLSRFDSSGTTLVLEPNDIEKLIETGWKGVNGRFMKKSVVLEIDVKSNCKLIRCDRKWMESVITNLLENAVKHSPPGARIEAAVASYKRPPAEYGCQIIVRDHGEGIAPEELDYIFDRFYRAPGNTQEGSGLGLSIAKSVIEAHGGRIWAESVPGSGSAFYIQLPAE